MEALLVEARTPLQQCIVREWCVSKSLPHHRAAIASFFEDNIAYECPLCGKVSHREQLSLLHVTASGRETRGCPVCGADSLQHDMETHTVPNCVLVARCAPPPLVPVVECDVYNADDGDSGALNLGGSFSLQYANTVKGAWADIVDNILWLQPATDTPTAGGTASKTTVGTLAHRAKRTHSLREARPKSMHNPKTQAVEKVAYLSNADNRMTTSDSVPTRKRIWPTLTLKKKKPVIFVHS